MSPPGSGVETSSNEEQVCRGGEREPANSARVWPEKTQHAGPSRAQAGLRESPVLLLHAGSRDGPRAPRERPRDEMSMDRDIGLQTFESGFSSRLSSRAEGPLGLDWKAL